MSEFDGMARDGGYRGGQAREVAWMLEEQERRKAERVFCPMGCGWPTDDPYGGPCEECWREVEGKRP